MGIFRQDSSARDGFRDVSRDPAVRDSLVSVNVSMSGTCQNGHGVSVSTSVQAPRGSSGVTDGDTTCGRCGASAFVIGTY